MGLDRRVANYCLMTFVLFTRFSWMGVTRRILVLEWWFGNRNDHFAWSICSMPLSPFIGLVKSMCPQELIKTISKIVGWYDRLQDAGKVNFRLALFREFHRWSSVRNRPLLFRPGLAFGWNRVRPGPWSCRGSFPFGEEAHEGDSGLCCRWGPHRNRRMCWLHPTWS